ncbi:MAG TPA: glycosyltransferase [Longimicrobium sp.]|nr:glycosyltransferase [Longimicrobium sp.]
MRLSVIVSTYNKPRDLERVLRGYAAQTDRGFELLVADDGSGAGTAAIIDRVRREAALPVIHVWHEDRGFRKSEIMNRAIVASTGDYLLFTDGDSIPRADLVGVHRALARPGAYLGGGYLKLSPEASDAITVDDVREGRFVELRWLRARGWRAGRRALRLVRSPLLAATLDRLTPTAPLFAGNNASVWREAMLAVNGFDMEMGYGGLDRAVGYRLVNLGIRGIQVRHRAVCMHLHHDRPYKDPGVMRRNREILESIRRTGQTRARRGIAELEPDPALRIDRGGPDA